ncbi:MAG: AraC family transcriptional regulator ligand-binding domain-containing protein [Burkholderiales bacterium]|nr:AraC family transcriptional regulator ligand-binding domain-containing protein [Burkholderiales bacterium]MBH2017939.1 AraC family transcriptional regulator ligand-binding domain-containing protein [Burkholderiales bacterium]
MSKNNLVPARYVALLVQILEEQGIDCTPALGQAGVPRASLRHNDALLSPDQVIAATRLLTEASGGQRDLGMRIGATTGAGQFGELGLGMLSCATVQDGLDLCARYYVLVTPSFSMRTRRVGSVCELSWQPIQPVPYDVMVLAFDLTLMSFHTQLQGLLRDDMPGYDAHLFSPAPPDTQRYDALKPGRCHFGQGGLPSLRIVIDAEVLSRTPMPLAHAANLADICQRLDVKLIHHLEQDQRDWRAWVTMMLTEAQGHQPTQDELAAIVNVSTSTLARHLAAQGTTFRELANEIRHERACQWLREGRLRVSDVAELLGYTDPANFIRAFKARSGVSPTQYSKAQRP